MSLTEEAREKRKANLAKAREAKKAKAFHDKRNALPLAPKNVSAAAPVLDPLAGLTQTECPIDCEPNKCVITHAGICGHPCKGALQPIFKGQPECVQRYNKARKFLLHDTIERRK